MGTVRPFLDGMTYKAASIKEARPLSAAAFGPPRKDTDVRQINRGDTASRFQIGGAIEGW
jgi:hypothetical protein